MPAPDVTNKLVNSDTDTDDEFPSLEAIIKSLREAKQARQVDVIDMTGDAEHCALCPKELRFGLDVFLFPACLCVRESSPQQDIDGNGYNVAGECCVKRNRRKVCPKPHHRSYGRQTPIRVFNIECPVCGEIVNQVTACGKKIFTSTMAEHVLTISRTWLFVQSASRSGGVSGRSTTGGSTGNACFVVRRARVTASLTPFSAVC